MNFFIIVWMPQGKKKINHVINEIMGGGEEYFRHGNMDMWEGNKI